jgi:hypothetical protein
MNKLRFQKKNKPLSFAWNNSQFGDPWCVWWVQLANLNIWSGSKISARNSRLCKPWHIWWNQLRAGSREIQSSETEHEDTGLLLVSFCTCRVRQTSLAHFQFPLWNYKIKWLPSRHSLALLLLMDFCCLGDFWKI